MKRWVIYIAGGLFGGGLIGAAIIAIAIALIYPSLPSLEVLTDYRPKMPLRVYSEDGVMIGEFGEERRAVVKLQDTPVILRQAILAAEDERFYQHGGIDTLGVLRAAVSNLTSGGAREGASTITMQVARNFFLSSEKTFRRKLNEALLAIKIEHALSKDEILELYINHIYLGQRAYGFATAAQTYFGKPLANINAAEAAMLAGLPKAPSAYNPVVNPSRAKARQGYVLKRLRELGHLSQAEYEQAREMPLQVRHSPVIYDTAAGHMAEMVRQIVHQKYGDTIYVSGMKAYTTLKMDEQRAAEEGVRLGVVNYNRRRGYPGPEGFVELPQEADARKAAIDRALSARDDVNGLLAGVVVGIEADGIDVALRRNTGIQLGKTEIKYASLAGAKANPKRGSENRLRVGSIVRVVQLGKDQPWQLTYLPKVEAALVAVSPETGAIRALVGGFDFARNQFNHVFQAWRQPGSSFKPFIYSAALEKGITPATVFEDAPVEIDPFETGGQLWEPKNYDGEMDGLVTVRTALTKSKNLVAIRLLQATGAGYAKDHAVRFGFTPDRIPPYLTLALGAGEVTPIQLATAYSVFANQGLKPTPYFLTRIVDKDGKVLESFQPPPVERVIDPRNAFIMTSMMQDVVRRGTAAGAMKLGRFDLAGKTGTTNDHRDAWFAGFGPTRVAVSWIGYDQPRPLGYGETGGTSALPIWMHYMATALANVPQAKPVIPEGVAIVSIDPQTGEPKAEGGVNEFFYEEFTPLAQAPADEVANTPVPGEGPKPVEAPPTPAGGAHLPGAPSPP